MVVTLPDPSCTFDGVCEAVAAVDPAIQPWPGRNSPCHAYRCCQTCHTADHAYRPVRHRWYRTLGRCSDMLYTRACCHCPAVCFRMGIFSPSAKRVILAGTAVRLRSLPQRLDDRAGS
jgi:hypothetical protein